MKLSKLNELPTSRDMIDVFGGYNHNLRIREGEFYDMTNLTSADYPVLSPRPKRGIYKPHTEEAIPSSLIAKDELCYVDRETLYINKHPVAGMSLLYGCDTCIHKSTCANYREKSLSCPKTMVSMGAYVIIMPDKVWVNTAPKADEKQWGYIEAEAVISSGTVKFSLCKVDGTAFKNFVTENGEIKETKVPSGATAPPNPNNLDYWIDTSSTPIVIKQYSSTSELWTSVATTYIKISSPNIGKAFEVNDGVIISGITIESLKDLNNTMIVWDKGDDYIVVTGILERELTQDATEANPIKIERRIPNMDFIIESGNRLWGCRYGLALNGEVVNEIYASKLGDFKNWHCYAGISTDSYAATVGTDGQFTGAVTHMGYPIFFKENNMHKVYGNYPANYQIQTTACRGVQKGCSKSLAIVNETLFYKSRSAICAYDGSLPVEMSSALGDVTYSDAVAGVLGNKYYISMKDAVGEYHLFVYDVSKGMWHREDNTQAVDFCNCRGNLYYIDYDDNKIRSVIGEDSTDTTRVEWRAETGFIGTDLPDKKYISRLVVRLSLEAGSSVVLSIEYDSLGAWEHLFTMDGTSLKTFSVPIKPKRCDHLRLRIDGEGNAKIFSITKTIEQGSDV
jgi:hypothetical protein